MSRLAKERFLPRPRLRRRALHVWSAARGKKQAHESLGAVRAALHDRPLSLVGHSLINLRHAHFETRRTSDGESIHGLARFRALTEQAPAGLTQGSGQ